MQAGCRESLPMAGLSGQEGTVYVSITATTWAGWGKASLWYVDHAAGVTQELVGLRWPLGLEALSPGTLMTEAMSRLAPKLQELVDEELSR